MTINRRSIGVSSLLWTCFAAVPVFADQYSDAVLADNPVAYYRLDEGGGAFIADNVASADFATDGFYNDFFSSSGPGTLAETGPRPGDITGGYVVDGFSATNNAPHFGVVESGFTHVSVPESEGYALDITMGGLTLEAWVNRDPGGGNDNEGIISKYQSYGANVNQRAYNLYYDPNPGYFALALSETGANQPDYAITTSQGIPAGEWVHVAATWEPGVRSAIYVNGELAVEQTDPELVPEMLHNSTADVWIGQQFDERQRWTFEGRIDEVAVYNQALTQSQVQAHFDAATGSFIDRFVWNGGGSGDWNDAANWDPESIPTGNAVTAVFGSASTSPQTVYTESNVLIGGVEFDNSNSFAIGGFGSLVLDAPNLDNATVNVMQGDHQIQTPVLLQKDTDVTVDSGSLSINNTLDLNGHTLTIQAGEVEINNQVIPGDGGMIVNSGSLSLATASVMGGDLASDGSLGVDLGGKQLGQYGALTVDGTATLSGSLVPQLVDGFSFANGDAFTVLTADSLVDNGIALDGSLARFMELSVQGNSLVLTATSAVPEPASFALALVVLGLVCGAHRHGSIIFAR